MTCCLVHRNLKILYGLILNGNNYSTNITDVDSITCLFDELMFLICQDSNWQPPERETSVL